VVLVGTFHLSNPNHDLHNVHVADVLAPNYQRLPDVASICPRIR
jgi:hypothetical protein